MRFVDGDPVDFRRPEYAEEYADWLVTPPHLREYPTQADWCEAHDLTYNQIKAWKRTPWWKEMMKEREADPYGLTQEHDAMVITALAHKAMQGDVRAIGAYMDLRGIQEKANKQREAENAATEKMTNAELADQIDKVANEFASRLPEGFSPLSLDTPAETV